MEDFKIIFIGIFFIIILKFYKYKYIKQNEIIEVKNLHWNIMNGKDFILK
jgi:hypothetical protein